jgi:hypothetical protein
MANIDAVIAVAGWEERFEEGLRLDLDSYRPSKLLVFVFKEYLADTKRRRADISDFAKARKVEYKEVAVKRDPIQLWTAVRDTFSEREWSQGSAVVDISTMPREVIWWTFSWLRSSHSEIRYVYYKPRSYATDWLTRDTDQPRLVYQHSGVSEFGKHTCLLLLSGFDNDRAAQMIQFFEPRLVLVGQQSGTQYDNQVKNAEQSKRLLERTPHITFFDVDAYSSDHGLAAIENIISGKLAEFNIVAASLGPKPSAVALYQLYLKHPEIALAYAPSRQFNPKYSAGIGDCVQGVLVGSGQ